MSDIKNPATPLEFRAERTRGRLIALLEKVHKNSAFRETFVKNPSATIARDIFGEEISHAHATQSNRLLYSLLANPGYKNWIEGYVKQHKNKITKQQFAKDFALAVLQFGDPTITANLAYSSVTGFGLVNFGDDDGNSVAFPATLPSDARSSQSFPVSTPQNMPATGGIDFNIAEVIELITDQVTQLALKLSRTGALTRFGEEL